MKYNLINDRFIQTAYLLQTRLKEDCEYIFAL